MKTPLFPVLLLLVTLWGILTSGCTTNTVEGAAGGAAVGAASASLVGALTDLVVDGRVNQYRLERNLVGGAIVGGAAGALSGAEKDRAEAAARSQPPAPPSVSDADATLIAEIGQDNYDALVELLNFRHEAAYKEALKAAKSKDRSHRLSALVVQALIDRDRNVEAGMLRSLEQFVAEDHEVKDLEQAKQGLEVLHQELLDERKVSGIR